ncbi:MAG: acyl-CoA dehydrogenase family protein [Planctomycetota bacterium]|nr:acyl-CoA dehydrogenase family protein [Planctomycetota bacterium]
MSHKALELAKEAAAGHEEQLLIGTAGMNRGQRAAMEVVESARDQGDGKGGFAAQLCLGRFDPAMLTPFPKQSDSDRRIGDEMVQAVSAFVTEHLDPDEVDETRTIPQEVIEGLKRLGVFRMKVPQEYGGLGFSQVNYNRVIMAIASYCGSTAVLVSAHQSIGVPQPLKMFGTEAQKAKYLRRIAGGELSAFALTEAEVGSDPARMTTTAKLSDDGAHYILNGVKLWTTNGPIAQLIVVMAQTAAKVSRGRACPQITAFIVEADSPGVEVTHRCDFMGLRGIQNGLIRFDNVKVPAENVIWGEGLGLKLALKTLNTGRLTLPAACAGIGKQCLSIVRQWGNDRVQWGLPIGRHEAGSQKIAFIACTTFAIEAVTWLTSHWVDRGLDIRIEAAMAKLFCTEATWEIVDQTMQLRGGRGYERAASLRARGEAAYPVERMMRDCRINTIIEGTSEIMRLYLAREALDPHLKLAADLLRDGIPLKRKLKAAGRLVRFYARWYPAQLFGSVWPKRYRSMGRLRSHYRYIDRASHKLAAAMFGAMARHRQKLERRQVLLGHLMDVGTELFAMAATCGYARSLASQEHPPGDPLQLAELFCLQARRRIEQHFQAIRWGNQRSANALAAQVLSGEFQWMEQGVISPQQPDPSLKFVAPNAQYEHDGLNTVAERS